MFSEKPSTTEAAGIALAFVAVLGVIYLACFLGVEQAQGALYTVLAAAGGYIYRGKVERQSPPPAPPEDHRP